MGTGNKLKELLKKKNMTVADLSRKTGISAQTLYSIINRDSSISHENRLLIAEALGITVLDFLDNELYDVATSRDAEHEEELIEQKINEIINSSTYSNEEKEKELQKLISQLEIMQYFHERNAENAKKLHTIYIDTEGMEKHPYNVLQAKINNGEELTTEEYDYLIHYTKEAITSSISSLKNFGERLKEHYELLNDEGKKKADEQLDRTIEQIEMLTKIPEYRNVVDLFSGIRGLDLPEGDTTVTFEMITDDDKKEED